MSDFYRVNIKMMELLSKGGILLDKIYFCPHSKSEGCLCRKPGTLLFERAEKELNLDKQKSFMIGDMLSDAEAGKNYRITSILLSNEKNIQNKSVDYVAQNLTDALKIIKEKIQ